VTSAARPRSSIGNDAFLVDAIRGLGAAQPSLPPKYFYDDAGARLFEQICELDEYYLTRTETAILRSAIGDIAANLGAHARIVEPGSGSGDKTRILLSGLEQPAEYIPIDISAAQLLRFAADVAREYPHIRVTPIAADYTLPLKLPPRRTATGTTVAFFPGSTLGNFEPPDAADFLRTMRTLCGASGALLLGTDLHKDTPTLERAYNDEAGVTAAFNLNILARLQRECGAAVDIDAFRHQAVYDADRQRIEMRLVAARPTAIGLDGRSFAFETDSYIITEYSHKYTTRSVDALARRTGWRIDRCWRDDASLFGVWLLRTQ
jgi:L-histidine Nalpha-methyltransferase